ncbi:MAG: hypothetical protein IV086_01855 [Hyphomonadaceae bacterium]|nr:MAG: hypothetical protein FD160_3900 [Caulobacteraceae bacterium]MBT9444424.1 hypothetical protein [Hyphomonadaceae bacterium]TPW01441.1 MAG: hypothetical protein FD124_3708 [Alphaproteobacteria bacterium]
MLPARIGAALALIGPAAFAVSACGEREAASAPEQTIPAGVLSPEWAYTPASAETKATTGMLTVEAGIDALGPSRMLRAEKGVIAFMHLSGEVDPAALVGARPVGELMALRDGARPMLQKVDRDGGLCGATPASYVVWYEPELIEGRELVLAVVQGAAPGETGSTVCRVLRYTREREAGKSEEGR